MITYPVDADSRWSIWSITDAAIRVHNRPWPRADGAEITSLDPDLIPLLEVNEDQPIFDPVTHYLTRSEPVVDVAANTHTHGWTILPRSQEDLDNEAEREIAKAQYADLMAGTGTQLERLVRVERVAAYMLKNMFGP